jgi:hypothetical protein
MARAPPAKRGFFPLDEQLALLPGSLTPRLHEQLVRLGSWIPFDPTAAVLAALTGATVTEATVRRRTEQAGAILVAWQEEEVRRLERECPSPPEGPRKQFLSVDGAFVPLLHGEWAEVRTLTLGVIDAPVLKEEEWVAPTREHSYFSRLVDADTFGRLALVETHRRGTETAAAVAAVTDGAEWEQGFIDQHRGDAVRILDFPHAAQRLSPIAQAVWGAASSAAREWVKEQARGLKQEGPAKLLAQIDALCQAHPAAEGVVEHRNYLQKREGQMQYPSYRAQGLPIGSGAMESANKLVVEARLKGAGMHWERGHVDPMLALRNAVCSDRWEEAWRQIERGLREQGTEKRAARRRLCGRAEERSEETGSLQQSQAAGGSQAEARATGSASSAAKEQSPADHPWRRFHIGGSTSPPRAVMMRARQ